MGQDFKDIAKEEKVTLDQTSKAPLFLQGEFCNLGRDGGFPGYLEIDTGSDRVIVSRQFCEKAGLSVKKFKVPRKIIGVDSNSVTCEDYCIFCFYMNSLEGKRLKLTIVAYVCELEGIPNLLGNDVMNGVDAVIDYKQRMMTVKGEKFRLHGSRRECEEACLREGSREPIYFCSSGYIMVEPFSQVRVNVYLTNEQFEFKNFTLVGESRSDLFVYDVSHESKPRSYETIICNRGHEPVSVKAGERLGRVYHEGMNIDGTHIETYKIETIDTKIRVLRAINIADLPSRRKLKPSQFDQMLENGVVFEEEMTPGAATELNFPEPEINEQKEIEKNRKIEFWDRNTLMSHFKLDVIANEMREELSAEEVEENIKKIEDTIWSFRGVFFTGDWAELSEPLKMPPVKLQLVENYKPCIAKYRRQSPAKMEILKKIVADLRKANIVRPSEGKGNFVSNPHIVIEERLYNDKVVTKPRFTIDFKNSAVNSMVKSEVYPLKNIDEVLHEVTNKGRIFSVCDAVAYFFQIPLDEACSEITSFYFGDQIMEWLRCAMGIKSVPSISQRCTDMILKSIKNFAKGFIDDFFLFSLCYLSAVKEFRQFLVVCSYYNLKLKPEKCNILKKVQTFLGYRVSHKSVHRLIPTKITNLRGMKSPDSKKALRSFLGLVAWYQNRCPLRDRTYHLRQLAKNNVRFNWEEKHETELRDSIEIILDPTTNCLRPPISVQGSSEAGRWHVFSDSSKLSFGGLLMQLQPLTPAERARDKVSDEFRLYLIEYFSTQIHERDMILPIAILELISLEKTLSHWKHYLQYSRFVVFTDSRYVSYWVSLDIISERVARAIHVISQYDLVVKFLPSTLNCADFFSRVDLRAGEGEGLGGRRGKAANTFKDIEIYNAEGVRIPAKDLFSREKLEEMNGHFLKKKNGMLVDVLRMTEIDEKYGLFCNGKRGSSAPCPTVEPCRVTQPSDPFATPSRGVRSGYPTWGRPRGNMTDLSGRSDSDSACSACWGPAVDDRLSDRCCASARERGARHLDRQTDRCCASARERGARHLDRQTDGCCASARERGPRHLGKQTDECSASARERGARHSIEKGTKERSFARNGF